MTLPKAPTRARVPITAEQRSTAIDLANQGMSLEGIAHSIGLSRDDLRRERAHDQDLDRELMSGFASYELMLLARVNAGGEDGAQAEKTLARRFPARHGADPRFRHELDVRLQDEPDASEAPSSTGDLLSQAINRLLDDREGPRE